MRLKIFEGTMGNLFAENRLLKMTVAVIGISSVWLGYRVENAVSHQRTILIPAGLDRRVNITDGYASEDYVRAFVRTLSSLAFTYNPSSARGQFGELLQYFSPDTFPAAKQSFFALAETIERTRVSSAFIISRPIEIDQDKHTVTVTGTLRQWVDTTFNDVTEKTYYMSYKLIDGRFMVTGITEKPSAGNSAAQGKPQDVKDDDSFKPVQMSPAGVEGAQ